MPYHVGDLSQQCFRYGLFPDCTKPLPEPILSYHQQDPLAFIRSIRHDKSTPNPRTRKFHQIREHNSVTNTAAACGTLEQQQCVSSISHATDPPQPAPTAAAASGTQTRQQTAHRLSQAGSSITHAVAAPLTKFSRLPYNRQ